MNMLYIKGPRMLPCGDRNEIPFHFENWSLNLARSICEVTLDELGVVIVSAVRPELFHHLVIWQSVKRLWEVHRYKADSIVIL